MNSIETTYIEQFELGHNWLRLTYDSGAAAIALPIAIAGDLPLKKCGEFRVASVATIPNLGKIKMKSTDESGIERTLRGWDSLLSENEGILLERRSPVSLEIRAVLAKHKVWSRSGRSTRLYREGYLYNSYVRTCDAAQELEPLESAQESWTRMEVDDGQRDEQVDCED